MDWQYILTHYIRKSKNILTDCTFDWCTFNWRTSERLTQVMYLIECLHPVVISLFSLFTNWQPREGLSEENWVTVNLLVRANLQNLNLVRQFLETQLVTQWDTNHVFMHPPTQPHTHTYTHSSDVKSLIIQNEGFRQIKKTGKNRQKTGENRQKSDNHTYNIRVLAMII